jgi:hypothetical protein
MDLVEKAFALAQQQCAHLGQNTVQEFLLLHFIQQRGNRRRAGR